MDRASISGLVFNIMRFSIRDGPGIRTTVFLKGCLLSCPWCHNPEGIATEPEIVHRPRRCLGCGGCIRFCSCEALSLVDGRIVRRTERCRVCGACIEACPAGAHARIGTEMTVSQVIEEVAKDLPFYEESGGGVTISGGEPLCQPGFLSALLRACREDRIHTVLDTSGAGSFELITQIRGDVDLFLYDLKLIDEDRHLRQTGLSNRQILENLRGLVALGQKIVIRVPVIPGCNDDEENIRSIGCFLAGLRSRPSIELLAYHKAGEEKYVLLGKGEQVPSVRPPGRERLTAIADLLRTYDLEVIIGA